MSAAGGPVWPVQMITPAEALAKVIDEPVYLDGEHFRHRPCGQSVGRFARTAVTCPGDFVSAVLRHMVMAHDLPLNTRGRDQDGH